MAAQARTAKEIVTNVLSRVEVDELWTTGFRPVLPVTPQGFSLGAVLPAVLYMFRWGHRRGHGRFIQTFGSPDARRIQDKAAKAIGIASKLTGEEDWFEGFDRSVHRAILADLLLAFCLENRNHGTGREQPVQRVFPTHYFSSWIDLPLEVGHLRGIPELLVTILVRQQTGTEVGSHADGPGFSVGKGIENNPLLSLLGPGTFVSGQADNLESDKFDEETKVGIDQLLTVRLAHSLGAAPFKSLGKKARIRNQYPAALFAADCLYEDVESFIRNYGQRIPRLSFLPLLESCLAVGLTNIYLSTIGILQEWQNTGTIPDRQAQRPYPLLVDCSLSTDRELRRLSEECTDILMQRIEHLPVIFTVLKILDQWARQERLQGFTPEDMENLDPDPSKRISFLGKLFHGSLDVSHDLVRDYRRTCSRLADALREAGEERVEELLATEDLHPVQRMAEAIVLLMSGQFAHCRAHLDSCLLMDEPNGIGKKRRTTVQTKSVERRSVVLTNVALDFLVHRHIHNQRRAMVPSTLSVRQFMDILRERYGFLIDRAPDGMSIPGEVLLRNRDHLERRLRDLGLLTGANDAESMKRLRPRFQSSTG